MEKIIQISTDTDGIYALTADGKVYIWSYFDRDIEGKENKKERGFEWRQLISSREEFEKGTDIPL